MLRSDNNIDKLGTQQLPSNFGMSEGGLVGIEGQLTSWCMGLFINWLNLVGLTQT